MLTPFHPGLSQIPARVGGPGSDITERGHYINRELKKLVEKKLFICYLLQLLAPSCTQPYSLHTAWGILWCHFLDPQPAQEFLITPGVLPSFDISMKDRVIIPSRHLKLWFSSRHPKLQNIWLWHPTLTPPPLNGPTWMPGTLFVGVCSDIQNSLVLLWFGVLWYTCEILRRG